MKSLIISLVLNAFVLLSAACSQVISMVTPNDDDSFTYSYEIVNGGDFPIFQWSLVFPFDELQRDWDPLNVSLGGDVIVPLGDSGTFFDDWEAGAPSILFASGGFAQDFTTLSPLGFGDVLPGESLSGFSFVSSLAPGEVGFTVFGPGGESNSGVVIGPAIPEPSSLLLLVLFAIQPLFTRRR